MPPLSLLTDILSAPPQKLAFDEKHCLRKRLSSSDCSYCIDSCPSEALSLNNGKILLNTQKCSDCMQCLAVCPNEAFHQPGYSFDSGFRPTQDCQPLFISCSRQSAEHPDDQIVPCMGMFSVELLLLLGMTGPPVISFNISNCSTCENKASSYHFVKTLEYLEEHASSLLKTEFDVVKNRSHTEFSQIISRRDFISNVGNNCISAVKSQFCFEKTGTAVSPSQARRIPYKTRLIKKMIDLTDNEEKEQILSLCSHQVSISSECTLCPLCTGICPTGAIKVKRLNGNKQLLFNAALCSGCGLCVSFCKKKAISLTYPSVSQISIIKEADLCC